MNDVSGVAVDLGGTKIAVARYLDGTVVDEHRVATERDAGSQSQVNTILQLLDKVHCSASDQIGVAVSGRVDSGGNWYAVNTETLSGIEQVPLKQLLEQRLKQPVTVINDAVAGGLAEATYGAGAGVSAFAYITVSTGVGGVCVLNGRPVVSENGLAGHIGFMTARNAVQLCGSGRRGTVESIASGRAMERQALVSQASEYSAKEITELHLAGNTWATEIVETSAAAIAELSANLAAALGISKIVLGGGVGLSQGFDEMVQAFAAMEPMLFQVQVERATLGSQVVLVGALTKIT